MDFTTRQLMKVLSDLDGKMTKNPVDSEKKTQDGIMTCHAPAASDQYH
jgi:hypothetical protein